MDCFASLLRGKLCYFFEFSLFCHREDGAVADGVMMVQLILLSISIIFKTSLAPITYLQIVPTIGQPSLVYVLLWPAILIAMSLFSFRVPKIEA